MPFGFWGVVGIVALVVVFALIWVAGAYNSLVALRNRFRTAFSQIDVQLKRRHDLIPNLVETVRGYLAHEKGTLEAVTEARNRAVSAVQSAAANPSSASAMAGLAAAESQLTGSLGRLFAVAEAYPDLKANQNMVALQQELAATENQIAAARQVFNASVMNYNTTLQSFPTNLVANAMGFAPAQLFELESDKERQVPQVSF
ncbi:LemA family protein [Aquisphaera giovannonii]|uniref:LemA family protein n=1 Tax=Aquisphaera giovannonii TaxID=406548 RepID=A0A5B9WC79_9BACT|nr:LemA family protein [Aquisphaera giovannonii]QEH37874.1 LemA family protein [Aquisphaera giovannonii]